MMGHPAELVIRPGSALDLAAVIAIEKRVFEDPWSAEALFGELQSDGMRIPLVAQRGDDICGYLMAWLVADQLHILNIATDPEFIRQGVGTRLLLEAVKSATPRGAIEATLEVRQSNHSARDFYRRYNFLEVGTRPGYYQDNGEDAIIMTAACQAILDD